MFQLCSDEQWPTKAHVERGRIRNKRARLCYQQASWRAIFKSPLVVVVVVVVAAAAGAAAVVAWGANSFVQHAIRSARFVCTSGLSVQVLISHQWRIETQRWFANGCPGSAAYAAAAQLKSRLTGSDRCQPGCA